MPKDYKGTIGEFLRERALEVVKRYPGKSCLLPNEIDLIAFNDEEFQTEEIKVRIAHTKECKHCLSILQQRIQDNEN